MERQPHNSGGRTAMPAAGASDQALHLAREAREMLDLAARVGLRGVGHVEPNPAVGCVIVGAGPGPARERIIGIGHHRRFGGPHAEADALANCRARGNDPAGATVYVTLEPCNAPGKQPACVDALIAARIGRVVCARRDPHPAGAASKGGGAARLCASGIPVEFTDVSAAATALAEPFVKRLNTGLPWVIAKWAQTIDGKIATRTGESQWISNERSRRLVHLTRARVDAILTGIGTVKADDPQLTARGVPRRRNAIRAVIDPGDELAESSRLAVARVGTELVTFIGAEWNDAPIQIDETSSGSSALPTRTRVVIDSVAGNLDLTRVLRWLHNERGVSTVLCECGPGFTSRLLAAELVDELHIYIAPMLMGDSEARPAVRGMEAQPLANLTRWRQVLLRRVGDDVLAVYRRAQA